MSPREPTPSRLRSRPRRCALTAPASQPRRMVACSDVDGTPRMVAWSRALATPTPLARLLGAPLSPWDAGAEERAVIGAALAAWPMPVAPPPPPHRYAGRANVEPPPLRQVDVAGDLAAALAGLADVPTWIDPAAALARARAVVVTPGTTRAQMLAAIDGKGTER